MIYSATNTPYALYTFPQPDSPWNLLLLTPVVRLATDARTFEPFAVPGIEPDATSAPSWVPTPEIIRADSLDTAARNVTIRIANRIGAELDPLNWPGCRSNWRTDYVCRWCCEPIAPLVEAPNHYIWASVHDDECAVRTFLSNQRQRTRPRINRRRIAS